MAQQQLPDAWRKAVCAILKTGRTAKEILWPIGSTDAYEKDFLSPFPNEVYPSFLSYLQAPSIPTGCLVTMEKPPGETYEFYFQFKGKKTYGKILLHTNRKTITIFSAHLPTKSKLRCE